MALNEQQIVQARNAVEINYLNLKQLLDMDPDKELKIKRPTGITLTDLDQSRIVLEQLEFPVMARPSFVLGGMSMKILHDSEDFHNYLKTPDQRYLSQQYLQYEILRFLVCQYSGQKLYQLLQQCNHALASPAWFPSYRKHQYG
mgnify:CR=1 FL=1